MYITGIGRTKFGALKESAFSLVAHAMTGALKDGDLSIGDIDAIYVANFLSCDFQDQLHVNSLIASLIPGIHIPIVNIETACASGGVALHQAILSLSKYQTIMVVGFEKMSEAENKSATKSIAKASDRILDQNNGLIFPGTYALVAQQHMVQYKTELQDLSLISLKNHNNSNLNENAHFYHKKVNIDMINRSPIVASPLRLFDCSPISDGAAALILSQKKRSANDVKILASEISSDTLSLSQRKDLTSFSAVTHASKKAYHSASLNPSDIDIAEVHDCFTISELIALEDLRFAGPGEGKFLVRNEDTCIGGKIPINTDGGLKANGHPIGASGIAQIFELVTQLRGEAGKRQVDRARCGLAHNIGGVGGTAAIHILGGS